MRTEHLQYLLEVVHCGSINKASHNLFMSQQQLSKIIASLEDEFNTQILLRKSKGIELTTAGKLVIDRLEPFLKEIEDLKREFSKPKNTSISGDFCVFREPSVVSDLFSQLIYNILNDYPELRINIVDAHSKSTYKALTTGECQVGIVYQISGRKSDIPDTMEFIPVLKRVPMVYAATQSSFCKRYNSTSLKALLKEPLIEYSVAPSENNILQQFFDGIGNPQIKYSVGNVKPFFDSLKSGKYVYVGTAPAKHTPIITDISLIPIRDKISVMQGLLVTKAARHDLKIAMFIEYYLDFYKKFMF